MVQFATLARDLWPGYTLFHRVSLFSLFSFLPGLVLSIFLSSEEAAFLPGRLFSGESCQLLGRGCNYPLPGTILSRLQSIRSRTHYYLVVMVQFAASRFLSCSIPGHRVSLLLPRARARATISSTCVFLRPSPPFDPVLLGERFLRLCNTRAAEPRPFAGGRPRGLQISLVDSDPITPPPFRSR